MQHDALSDGNSTATVLSWSGVKCEPVGRKNRGHAKILEHDPIPSKWIMLALSDVE